MGQDSKPVSSSQVLVGSGKSRRLSAMAESVQAKKVLQKQSAQLDKSGLMDGIKPGVQQALIEAQHIIGDRIETIMSVYPQNKKNSLFKLRFGVTVDQLFQLKINQIFQILKLDVHQLKSYRLVENLDLSGHD